MTWSNKSKSAASFSNASKNTSEFVNRQRPTSSGFLLREAGYYLLQESGERLLLEGVGVSVGTWANESKN